MSTKDPYTLIQLTYRREPEDPFDFALALEVQDAFFGWRMDAGEPDIADCLLKDTYKLATPRPTNLTAEEWGEAREEACRDIKFGSSYLKVNAYMMLDWLDAQEQGEH